MGVPGNANALLLRSAAAAGGYQVSRSLRFNSSDSAYCGRTPSAGGNQKTYTLSLWLKRSALGEKYFFGALFASSQSRYQLVNFTASDQIQLFGGAYTTGGSTTINTQLITTSVYRDTSAWYHILLAVDTTQATETNRVKLYVNGTQVTAFSTATYPGQNTESYINSVQPHYIGQWGAGNYFDGYLAEIHFIDGQALTPSSFAETDATTAQWIPKLYSGSYGTNGFKLTFADNSAATAAALGKDTSGNGNNFTPTNFSVAAGAGNDSLVDTPTSYGTDDSLGGSVRGNYATLNPLDKASAFTLENGNLQGKSTSSFKSVRATIGMPTGKWYWEHTIETTADMTGIQPAGAYLDSHIGTSGVGDSGVALGYTTIYNQGSSSSAGGATSNGAVVSVAFDADGGKLWFRVNGGSWLSGDPAAGTSPSVSGLTGKTYFPAVTGYNNSTGMYLNFGQRAFAYTAPSGFKALCDTNLTAPVVAKSSTVMDVKLYTGNGSTQSITGLAFNPDLVWIKSRNNAYDHKLTDALRGATKGLISDSTGAETTDTNGLTAFNSDGFSLGTDTNYNGNAATYVAWTWDAGSSTATNTQGSITGGAQVRANPSAGFSIITFTMGSGTFTVGHGLGTTPSLLITKGRNLTSNWWVYHASLGASQYLGLNQTAAAATLSWGASPTSTVFTANNNFFSNGYDHVVYAFSPVSGYSSFGSYTGNGSADGPFVYTGFRPRWVMIKDTVSTGGFNWILYDTARKAFNVVDTMLCPNISNAEFTAADWNIDILSNGFKIRSSYTQINTNGNNCIYAAFAESPFQFSRAR